MKFYELKINDLVDLVDVLIFCWLGWVDFVINSGGVKVYLEMIEWEIGNFFMYFFLVSFIFDVVFGEKVILVIEELLLIENWKVF